MATEIGVEVLLDAGPVNPNCTGGDIYTWIRGTGATLVKMRNHAFNATGRQEDINHVKAAVCAGLKLVTRPGPYGNEGLPMWDDNTNSLHGNVRGSIDRFYDAFLNGPGNHSSWYAHIIANEPQEHYRTDVATFERHLKNTLSAIIANGWTWIPFVTPPPMQYRDNEDAYMDAIYRAVQAYPKAVRYIGAHAYWNTDQERTDRAWKLDQWESRFAALGKPLLLDEFNVNSPYRAAGAPYDCTYVQNLSGDTNHSKRAGSARHFVFEKRYKYTGGKIIFALTGDQNWIDMTYLSKGSYNTQRCGANPWVTDPFGTSNASSQAQFRWIMEPNWWQ